jgi:hypothetical protein
MNIRKWLGLCEHDWSIEHGIVEHSLAGVEPKVVTGYTHVKECVKCHAVKGFRI